MHALSTLGKLLLWLCVLSLGGCGYTLRGSGSVLPPDVQRVYVPMVENNTAESGLGLTVTEAMRDEFERYGVLYVVETQREAHAVLRVKILSVKRETRTTTSGTDTVLQLDSILTLACQLRRTSGALLWQNNKVVVSKVFGASSDVVVTSSADFAAGSLSSSDLGALDSREISRGQERQVLEDLAEEAARVVYTQAVLPDF